MSYLTTAYSTSTVGVAKIVLIILEDASWTSLKINYFASWNPSILLGSFSGNSYSSFLKGSNQLVLTQCTSTKPSSTGNLYSVYAFISGVTTISAYSLNITQAIYNSVTGSISVTLSTASNIQNIQISYIILSSSLISSSVISTN